jgi:hypothetical protein
MTNKPSKANKPISYELFKANTIHYEKHNRIAILVNPTIDIINQLIDKGYVIKISQSLR